MDRSVVVVVLTGCFDRDCFDVSDELKTETENLLKHFVDKSREMMEVVLNKHFEERRVCRNFVVAQGGEQVTSKRD